MPKGVSSSRSIVVAATTASEEEVTGVVTSLLEDVMLLLLTTPLSPMSIPPAVVVPRIKLPNGALKHARASSTALIAAWGRPSPACFRARTSSVATRRQAWIMDDNVRARASD